MYINKDKSHLTLCEHKLDLNFLFKVTPHI